MRFFEIGFQVDGTTKSAYCARNIATGLELHTQVVLRLGILGIRLYRFAKFGERAIVAAGSAQSDTEHQVRRREPRVQLKGTTQCGDTARQISSLSSHQPQLEIHFC